MNNSLLLDLDLRKVLDLLVFPSKPIPKTALDHQVNHHDQMRELLIAIHGRDTIEGRILAWMTFQVNQGGFHFGFQLNSKLDSDFGLTCWLDCFHRFIECFCFGRSKGGKTSNTRGLGLATSPKMSQSSDAHRRLYPIVMEVLLPYIELL